MNAKELFDMLKAIDDRGVDLAQLDVISSDGERVTGIWTFDDTNEIVMVQPSKTTAKYKWGNRV